MDGITEPPEHRACRTRTTRERRGVEQALNEWRLGDSNSRNVYVGNRHVGVFFDPEVAKAVGAAMNAVRNGTEDGTESSVEASDPADAGLGVAQARRDALWVLRAFGVTDRR